MTETFRDSIRLRPEPSGLWRTGPETLMETPVSEPAAEQSPEQSSESSQPFEAVVSAEKPQRGWPKIILFSLLGLALLVGIGYGGVSAGQ